MVRYALTIDVVEYTEAQAWEVDHGSGMKIDIVETKTTKLCAPRSADFPQRDRDKPASTDNLPAAIALQVVLSQSRCRHPPQAREMAERNPDSPQKGNG